MRMTVLVKDVKKGSIIISDGNFTCLKENQYCIVHKEDNNQLYVKCSEGRHFLDGQLSDDGKTYIGFTHS